MSSCRCITIYRSNYIRMVKNEMTLYEVWQYGLWSFQTGGTKLERFLPKNQHTQRKLLNFENWVNGEVSKSTKIWLSNQKLSKSFSIFFSLKNINLGPHFLLLTFLITSIFKSLGFLKWCPIFDTSPLTQFSKFNYFLWVCWFLGKNISDFVPPVWKFHNSYCHNCRPSY